MKLVKLMLVGAVLMVTGATSAYAGPKIMATAPALAGYPQLQTMYCDIVNLNTTNKDVTIEIIDYLGAVISGPLLITLPPSTGQALGDGSGNGAWCRFTVDGSQKKYRAAAVYDDGTTYTMGLNAQ